MFPGCPEHCNAEGTLSEYSRNIACRLGIRLNATHYFIMNIPNKRELQQIASSHSSDIHFKDFMKLYVEYTKEPYSSLVNDRNLSSDNPLPFRKNSL